MLPANTSTAASCPNLTGRRRKGKGGEHGLVVRGEQTEAVIGVSAAAAVPTDVDEACANTKE